MSQPFLPEIRTKRLTLRPFQKGDAQDLYEYLSDPEVVRFEPYRPYPLESCGQEAENRSKNPAFIAVALGLPLLLMGLGAVKTKTAAIVVSSVLLGFFTLLTLGEGLPFVLYLDNGRYEIVNLSGFFAFQLECIAILVLAAGTESPAEYAARLQAETVGNGFAPMGNRGQFFAATNIKGNPYAEYGRNPYSAAYAPPARPTVPSSAPAPASVRPTYASPKASNVSAPARPIPAPMNPNASMPAKPMGVVSAGAPAAVEDKTEAIVKRMKLLERLKSEGLIDDEEYRAKREEILKNI